MKLFIFVGGFTLLACSANVTPDPAASMPCEEKEKVAGTVYGCIADGAGPDPLGAGLKPALQGGPENASLP